MATDDQSPASSVTPGSRWRILARMNDHTVQLEDQGVIDEIVIDEWLHLEQMHERQWWLRLGDARIWVTIEQDGTARVDVERGFYKEAVGITTS